MVKEELEQLIRVRIIPQLITLGNALYDDHNTPRQFARKLDSIIDEMENILNGINDI